MSEQALARRVAFERAQGGSELVLLNCRRVSQSGQAELLDADSALPTAAAGQRLVAVLAELAADGDVIVEELPEGHANVAVCRVITPIAVFDVTAAGLVIVELANALSAADVQERVAPSLKISPWVKVLAGEPGARDSDDR